MGRSTFLEHANCLAATTILATLQGRIIAGAHCACASLPGLQPLMICFTKLISTSNIGQAKSTSVQVAAKQEKGTEKVLDCLDNTFIMEEQRLKK
jgi:hypothetical protein